MQSLGKTRRLLGRMKFAESDDPPAFVVTASGAIGPRLVRDDLARAEVYGHGHPEGWCYIANVKRVLYMSPRNVRYLRRVRKLPNNRGYFVVATFPIRRMVPFWRVVGGPHKAFRSVDKALTAAKRRLEPPAPKGLLRRRRARAQAR